MTIERTPQAKALIRQAHDAAYRLADDPAGCVQLFYDEVLPKVPKKWRMEALRDFRELMHDDNVRLSFVLWLYMATLERYAAGELD